MSAEKETERAVGGRSLDQEVLRIIGNGPVSLSDISEPMRQYCIDLAMREPSLVEAIGGYVVITDEGRDYARRSR